MNDFLQNLRGGQKDNRAAKTRRGFDNNQQYNTPSQFNSNTPYQNPRVGNAKRPMRSNPQNQVQGEPQSMSLSSEIIENIMVLAETMIKNQEFLAATHERQVVAEERKADSLEEIAEYLRIIAMPSLAETSFEVDNCLAGKNGDGIFAKSGYQPIEEQEGADFQEEVEVEKPLVKKRRGRKPKALKLAEEKAAAEQRDSEATNVAKVKVLKRTKAEKMMNNTEPGDGKKELMSRDAVMEIVNSMRSQGATFDQVAQRLVELGQPTFSGRGEWHAQTVHRLCNTKN